jgi:hypothetical protein
MLACNAALSFSRLTVNDRSRLLVRQAELSEKNGRLAGRKSAVSENVFFDTKPISGKRRSAETSTENSNVLCSGSDCGRERIIPKQTIAKQIDSKPVFVKLIDQQPLVFLATSFLLITSVTWLFWRLHPETPVQTVAEEDTQSRSASDSFRTEPSTSVLSESSPENPIVVEPVTSSADPLPLNGAMRRENVLQQPRVETPVRSDVRVEPPSQSMSLKLRRSQRAATVTKKIKFALDARIGLTAEEHALVTKYRLGGLVIYDSKSREKYTEAAKAHLESAKEQPGMLDGMGAQLLGLGKTVYRAGRASVSATMAALALRITVDSLIRGVHVECDSLEELLEAEDAIRAAGANLKGYLATAATFDGREVVIEL